VIKSTGTACALAPHTQPFHRVWQAWSRWNICAIAISIWLALPAGARADTASTQHSYGDSRALDVTLFYPDGLELIRGVIVFTGGQGSGGSGDTRPSVNDEFWQAFAQSLGFGVLGTRFTGSYTEAASGPGAALISVLKTLGEQTSHPELEHAPLLLEGFSNGGYFSLTFSQFAPERVIAFCLNKSGFAKATLDPPFLAVPGMLFWGVEEPETGVQTVVADLVRQGRAQHALWAELREWGVAHEDGAVEAAFAPFFAEMVAARYPASADPSQGPVALLALSEASGWLADPGEDSVRSDVPTIAPFSMYPGDQASASWLPSEGLAKLWRGFVVERPLELALPEEEALIAEGSVLELALTGIPDTAERAQFFDQEDTLAAVAVSGSEAAATWEPSWGGVRGVAAIALSEADAVLHVSRPAPVVIQGKAPPMRPITEPPVMERDAGMAATGGKGGTSGSAGKPAAGSGGTPGAGGRPAVADAGLDAGVDDAGQAHVDMDAGKHRHDGTPLRGHCDCSLGPSPSAPTGARLAYAALALACVLARVRRRTRP
jgi:hypothetical protein